MRIDLRFGLTLAMALSVAISPVAAYGAPPSAAQDMARLSRDIGELARAGLGTHGRVGVAAWRLGGEGDQIVVNADEPFPMASTFKVAVAGAVLAKVDAAQLTLDKMIAIAPERMVPSEVIADRFIHPGVSLSVANLLELMLTQSDNTATDYLVGEAGGTVAVTAWVRAQGITDQRIDGDTDAIIRRGADLGPTPRWPDVQKDADAQAKLDAIDGKPNPAFDSDPRDTSTPRAMAQLLERIFTGRALSPASTKLLTEMMARCRTGPNRLRGLMPANTPVAHKTGTIGGTVNDVGVMTLPGAAGQVVIAVFIKGSDASQDARAMAIAQIARSLRDYYLYQEPAIATPSPARGKR